MYDFNGFKALIIAAALVVLSAIGITTNATESEVQNPTSENFVATPSQEYPFWSQKVWKDLFAVAERMFEHWSFPPNYVEQSPAFDADNAFEEGLVFDSKPDQGRSL